jgi:hypothetical protein
MVRLRVSKEEGKARRGNARWTRSALVRFDAYRRECIFVKLAGHDTSRDTAQLQFKCAARSHGYVPYLVVEPKAKSLQPTCIRSKRILDTMSKLRECGVQRK